MSRGSVYGASHMGARWQNKQYNFETIILTESFELFVFKLLMLKSNYIFLICERLKKQLLMNEIKKLFIKEYSNHI